MLCTALYIKLYTVIHTSLWLQDLLAMRAQVGGQINVDLDVAPQQDLGAIMAEIREHYESVAAKNRKDLEVWFDKKVRSLILPWPLLSLGRCEGLID